MLNNYLTDILDNDIMQSITSANTLALTKYQCLSWKTKLVTPCVVKNKCTYGIWGQGLHILTKRDRMVPVAISKHMRR